MSGSGNYPFGMQPVTVFPVGDNRTGVVFYRLFSVDLSVANVQELLGIIAEVYAQNGPFVVRYGFRKVGDEQYWFGLNHQSCGVTFEGMLRALAGGRRIRVHRAFHLPGDNPNPALKAFLGPDQVVHLHAKYTATANGGAPTVAAWPEPQPRPERPAPAEPVVKMGPFERMRAARAELAGTDLGQRFQRGRRGRRRQAEQPGDEQP